jgi:acyl carrier protein
MSDRKEDVRTVLKDTLRLDTAKIGDADPLFSPGLIDSFALLELITVLESTFNIQISAEKATIENLDTINGISDLLVSISSGSA